MSRLFRLGALASGLLLTVPGFADVFSIWDGTGANDSIDFSQLGGMGSTISTGSSLTSGAGNSAFVDFLGSGNGQVAVACPATPCNWSPTSLTAGDSLIWSQDPTSGGAAGPVGFRVGAASAVGALIEGVDSGVPFSATVQVFDTNLVLVNSFSVTSDAAGDGFFLGALDQTGNGIGAIQFLVTDGINDENFATDMLQLQFQGPTNTSVPESGAFVSLGMLLAVVLHRYRRRPARNQAENI